MTSEKMCYALMGCHVHSQSVHCNRSSSFRNSQFFLSSSVTLDNVIIIFHTDSSCCLGLELENISSELIVSDLTLPWLLTILPLSMKIQIVSESVNVRTSLVLEINSMVLVASSLKLIPTFGALKVTGLTFETLVLLKLRSQVAE